MRLWQSISTFFGTRTRSPEVRFRNSYELYIYRRQTDARVEDTAEKPPYLFRQHDRRN